MPLRLLAACVQLACGTVGTVGGDESAVYPERIGIGGGLIGGARRLQFVVVFVSDCGHVCLPVSSRGGWGWENPFDAQSYREAPGQKSTQNIQISLSQSAPRTGFPALR